MPQSYVIDYEVIRQSVPLSAVLGRYGVLAELKGRGERRQGACPLLCSNSRRCFSADLGTNQFQCFACGIAGGVIELVAALEGGIDIHEAATRLASWFGIPPARPTLNRRSSMSDNKSSPPTHKIFVTETRGKDDQGNDRVWWTRIGTMFKAAKGYTVVLSAHPIGSRMVALEFDDAEEVEEDEKPQKPVKDRSRR